MPVDFGLVRLSCGCWNGGVGEAVRARCWVLRDRTTLPSGGGDGFSQAFTEPMTLVGWGFWPSVENYIVDASILD